jgi:hypothetical protein
MNENKVGQGEGVKQKKNLPFFCLANHIFIHTVITRSTLVII